MKQVTFLQEGSNRILSKSKMFLVLYSCEYLSKLYIIYQSTYFIEYFMQDNSKYQRIKKIHQVLEKIARIDQKLKNSLYLVITGIIIYSYKNILHINLHILFIIYFKTNSEIQKLSKSNKYIKSYIQNIFYYFI